ncbi:MAG: LolA family protein, partial [Candidatus Binatia bacterium]
SSPEVETYLAELADAQKEISTLRARFLQEKRLSIVRDTLRSSGTLLLGEDGRIAWIVEEPEPLRIVIRPDGVFAGGKPVEAGAETLSPLPVLKRVRGLLAGLSPETLRDFEITREGPDGLRLVPRSPELGRWVRAIAIGLEPGRKVVRGLRLEEPEGDVTEIRFSEIELNPRLDERAFAP